MSLRRCPYLRTCKHISHFVINPTSRGQLSESMVELSFGILDSYVDCIHSMYISSWWWFLRKIWSTDLHPFASQIVIQTSVFLCLFLNRGMVDGSMIIFWSGYLFWYIVASQNRSGVLLCKIVQLPSKHWFNLNNKSEN